MDQIIVESPDTGAVQMVVIIKIPCLFIDAVTEVVVVIQRNLRTKILIVFVDVLNRSIVIVKNGCLDQDCFHLSVAQVLKACFKGRLLKGINRLNLLAEFLRANVVKAFTNLVFDSTDISS